MLRSSIGVLLLPPNPQALLCQLIDQPQKLQIPFAQNRAGALVAAIFGRPLPHPNSLIFGDGVEPVLALLTAGEDVGGVKLAGGTPAVGFAALAPEQIKGA